jgi:hypothetical protein
MSVKPMAGAGDLPDGLDIGASIGIRCKIFRRASLRAKTNLLNRFNKSARRANHPKVCPAPLTKIFRLTRRANQ